jgi:nickel/cobalt transporter (NicO) family protein
MTGRHRLAAILTGLGLAIAIPAVALAHPLGNFTVNHYAGIRVEPERVLLDVVVDQAEIPTFQEKLRIDTDGDGMVSDAEAEAERLAACPALAPSLSLSVDGRSLPLRVVEAGLSFPPGAAGLQTMRLVCVYVATLVRPIAAGTTIAFADGSQAARIGWREIVLSGSGVTIAPGTVPTTGVSDRLTAYPASLIAQPLDIRSASFHASPGGPVLPPLAVPDAAPLPGVPALDPPATGDDPASGGSNGTGAGDAVAGATAAAAGPVVDPTRDVAAAPATAVGAVPGGVGSEISGLLEQRDLTPIVLLGSLLAAMALGAGHALTPGHGKTLMGAYLVGARGTPVHAVVLGLSVTVSHTLGILVLAAVIIGLRGVVSPELYNRVAPVISGLLVLGIGSWLLIGQVAKRRTRAPGAVHEHEHEHEHDEDHDHELAHELEGTHSHGGRSHSHLPPTGGEVGWRSLFVLGLAGGVIPSTNALIILLSTIATGRAAYGLVLVVAFGLGMAVVLGGVGLGLVFARERVDTLPARSSLGRVAGYAPLVAGVLVFSLGLWLTSQAVGVTPTL